MMFVIRRSAAIPASESGWLNVRITSATVHIGCSEAFFCIERTSSGASAITTLVPKRRDRPRVTLPRVTFRLLPSSPLPASVHNSSSRASEHPCWSRIRPKPSRYRAVRSPGFPGFPSPGFPPNVDFSTIDSMAYPVSGSIRRTRQSE
jgi:hypothetical protein